MSLIDIITTLKKQNDISKALIFNDLTLTRNDIVEIGKYLSSLYVSFYNNFAVRTLFVQLRNCKNIHIVNPNSIPNINYDLICSAELTKPILFILSKIKYIKYYYCTNSELELIDEIPGFKKDPNIKNLYVKDSLIININEDEGLNLDNFSGNLVSLNNIERENIRKAYEEKQKNLIESKINEIKNQKKEKIKEEKIKPPTNKNVVMIKNIVSTLNKFSNFKEVSSINNGELDVCCFLSNKKDYDLFLKVIDYLNNNYSYIKYFIFLNGKTILKYFKEEKIKNLNYVLIKSKDGSDFKNTYSSIFELLTNGSYKFYMNEINFDAEMVDLL